MLRLARHDTSEYALAEGMAEAVDRLNDGSAFEKFCTLIKAQGGDLNVIDDPDRLPRARIVETLTAQKSGYIQQISALDIGLAALDLGAGRERKTDPIDHAVGIVVHKKVGDPVQEGEPIFVIHANDPERLEQAKVRLKNAPVYNSTVVAPLPTFYNTIYGERR
jgi:pyrimidine-nucleoside phosphorylase